MIETFIDVVSFMDIFLWFFTGDLHGETGLVVPKAFFGRCILPGTLVQVLDHPTLPEVLPSLLGRVASAAMNIGWSRVIRWVCAVVPALTMLVFQPLSAYFFRHFEDSNATGDEDILMSYAESFGYLPQRTSSMMKFPTTNVSGIQLRDSSDDDDDKMSDIDDDDDKGSSIERRSSFAGQSLIDIRSTPGSPARIALRGSLYINNNNNNNNTFDININNPVRSGLYQERLLRRKKDSTVRFANDHVSRQLLKNIDDEYDHDHDQQHNDNSSSCFEIGYSLSSHALDDL